MMIAAEGLSDMRGRILRLFRPKRIQALVRMCHCLVVAVRPGTGFGTARRSKLPVSTS
jgi:hypothetical protein